MMQHYSSRMISLVLLVCIGFSIVTLSGCHFGKIYNEDLYIESPDGAYRLLIQEWETIGGTGAEVYIESATAFWPLLTRREVGLTSADDCVFPFKDGGYSVDWEEDCVTIRYFSGKPIEQLDDESTWTGSLTYIFP